VDWKTGRPPQTPEKLRAAAVQLAVYRLAWAALQGRPLESVRAAFHYVGSQTTVSPDPLPDRDELARLITAS
jgi:DNA helicase-2/ATP-dependent DNA helicase PcrA